MAENFRFFKIPKQLGREIEALHSRPAGHWEKKGEKMALGLFQYASHAVPAYRRFLRQHKIEPSKIKTLDDFKRLPLMSKDNYLRRSRYEALFPKRALVSCTTVSATSGSTGEPFYFPRGEAQDAEYEYEAEIFLREQFELGKKRTLGVMGFALGIWIGGIFTFKVLNRLSENGYKLSVIPIGTNKEQFLRAIKNFGHLYDQIILLGYPPFIKDALDEGADYGIRWPDYEIKILTAAEGFSEKFREYLAKKAGLKNMLVDTINIYGTVELGTMAHETALSNLIRHLASKDKKLFRALFPQATNIPTLCQYYPHLVYFEEVDGEVIASGSGSSIPLVRYKFNDLGGVIQFEEMLRKLDEHGINLAQEMKNYGITQRALHLPFVYVYARSDFSVIFRGANIYPEEIRCVLDDEALSRWLTGRFTMMKKEDRRLNQVLEINVELKKKIKADAELEQKTRDLIIGHLKKSNSEFNNEYLSNPEKTAPRIIFWPHHHPLYFSRTGKQQWVKK